MLTRRALLSSTPALAALPAAALVLPAQETERDRMIRVIEQLEAWQGWEPSSIVAAKAFAAWRMREALGLDLPDPKHAQMHIDYQRENFERCQRSDWFKQDRAAGKVYAITSMERALSC